MQSSISQTRGEWDAFWFQSPFLMWSSCSVSQESQSPSKIHSLIHSIPWKEMETSLKWQEKTDSSERRRSQSRLFWWNQNALWWLSLCSSNIEQRVITKNTIEQVSRHPWLCYQSEVCYEKNRETQGELLMTTDWPTRLKERWLKRLGCWVRFVATKMIRKAMHRQTAFAIWCTCSGDEGDIRLTWPAFVWQTTHRKLNTHTEGARRTTQREGSQGRKIDRKKLRQNVLPGLFCFRHPNWKMSKRKTDSARAYDFNLV